MRNRSDKSGDARESAWCGGRAGARLLAVLVCAMGVSGAATAARADQILNIPYEGNSPATYRRLDVHRPWDTSQQPLCTVILIHGGSYSSGDKSAFTPVAQATAARGYGVVNMNYTLVQPGVPSFPMPVQEVLDVVRWVRTTGVSQYGLSSTIVIVGHSAGATIGNVASLAGTAAFTVDPCPSARGYEIDGLISLSGRSDLVWNTTVGLPQTVWDYVGTSFSDPDWQFRLAQASAVSYVAACAPPVVIYHGTNDALVPYTNSVRLANALNMADVPNQTHIVMGGSHDFYQYLGGPLGTALAIDNGVSWLLSQPLPGCSRSIGTVLGACCSPTSGACWVIASAGCAGTWFAGATCVPGRCPAPPPPMGACCDQGGACARSLESECQGTWTDGGVCAPSPCPPPPMGACCAPDGACSETLESACVTSWTSGGVCTPSPCVVPPPQGSCCAADGTCTETTESACAGEWAVDGVCVPSPCAVPPVLGACCAPDHTCTHVVQTECVSGAWTSGATCAAPGCEPPPPIMGACCRGSTCVVVSSVECAGTMSRFNGVDVACNNAGTMTTPCCLANFNQVDGVSVQDVFDFLAAWFAADPRADLRGNGNGPPGVQSIFDFLAAWFAGC